MIIKPTLLFVHGTGVRQRGFAASMRLLNEKMALHLPKWQLVGCFWGGAFGTTLNRGGASIPGYAATGDPQRALLAQQNSRWILLAADPLIELRVSPDEAYIGSPPGEQIWSLIEKLHTRETIEGQISVQIAPKTWSEFIGELVGDSDWKDLVTSLTLSAAAASPMVARAVVAELQRSLREEGIPSLTMQQRDKLCGDLVPFVGGPPQGLVGDWLLGRLTSLGRRHRGQLTDATTPAAGDVLRYQSRGEVMRAFIGTEAARSKARVVLGHSLGGIAAVDWLALGRRPIDALITAGSQAAYLYEIDALASRPYGSGLPDFFPGKWLNFYNENDMLSYPAEGMFKGRVTDVKVDNGTPFPESHSAYFGDERQVWPEIERFVGQL